jgi:hypothetical protein
VNDAPVINTNSAGGPPLTAINEDNTNSSGTTVGEVLGALAYELPYASDVDGDSIGIVISGADETNGTWQYKTGSTWINFPALTSGTCLLLANGASIRFVPDAEWSGTATFNFGLWDGTEGTNGSTVVNPSGSAYSSGGDTASITVNAVNDLPVGVTDYLQCDQDGSVQFGENDLVMNDTDIDSSGVTFYLMGGPPSHGTITYLGGGTYEYTPDTSYYGPDSFTYYLIDSDGGISTGTVNITVNPI